VTNVNDITNSRSRRNEAQSSWAAVYDGRTCIGHTIARGRLGVEAFDRDDQSIGVFLSLTAATAALEQHAAAP
jgi:hypothetical protein